MKLTVDLTLIIFLAMIAFQDFKQREISWFLIPILFSGFALKGLLILSFNELLHNGLFNILFLLVQFAALMIYFSIKNKRLSNIIDSQIGLGDLLFFIVMSLAFAPGNFIAFYISGMIITLIGFLIYSIRGSLKEIPLAGSMACIMIILILLNFCYPSINLYSDELVSNYLFKI